MNKNTPALSGLALAAARPVLKNCSDVTCGSAR
jgi:hypothetical protein